MEWLAKPTPELEKANGDICPELCPELCLIYWGCDFCILYVYGN
jgi:hypothetical protein